MTDNLYIAATPTSPEVDFRFDQRHLSLRGESYPENAAAFYGDILARTRDFLNTQAEQDIVVDIALVYFNSSSTKMLFSLFEALNSAAKSGNRVTLNWYYDAEDDVIKEFGEELRADFSALRFQEHPLSEA